MRRSLLRSEPSGGLASRHGERPARGVQRRRDRCHHHDHGAGVESAARHGPRRARAGCSGPAHLRLELRVCRHLLEQPPPHATRRPAHRRPRPLGEPAPALLALARAVYDRLGRRVSQGDHTDGDLRGRVSDGRCGVVAAAGCAGEAKRTVFAARACRRARPEGEAIGAALCLGDPDGLPQSLDRRRPLCAGRAHLVRSRSAHRAEHRSDPRPRTARDALECGIPCSADRRRGVPVLTTRPGMFKIPGKRERSRFMSGRLAHSSYPRWWVIFAIWTAWGLLLSTQVAVYVRMGGKPMPFLTALRLNMPGALVWAIFTPAAIWLARRCPPFEGPHWPRGVAVNLVASAIAVFLEVLLVIANQRWIRGPMPSDDPLFVAELRNFVWWFPLDGWLYWAIVAGDYGVAHYRRLRERELRASQLEAQLSEARLEALKMQLQPHFLFNALHTIGQLIRTGQDAL